MSLAVLVLIVLSGAALVLQNAVMLEVRGASGSLWAALWLNSAVGLVVLTAVLLSVDGVAPLRRLAEGGSAWFAVPGMLGTLYVLASLTGYGRLGAATTIALLVASQLVAGLVFDAWRTGAIAPNRVAGALLLVVGAALVSLKR